MYLFSLGDQPPFGLFLNSFLQLMLATLPFLSSSSVFRFFVVLAQLLHSFTVQNSLSFVLLMSDSYFKLHGNLN